MNQIFYNYAVHNTSYSQAFCFFVVFFKIYFVHTQLVLVYHALEHFYIVCDHIFTNCCFLLQKGFDTFHKPFFEDFIYFYDNIYLINI